MQALLPLTAWERGYTREVKLQIMQCFSGELHKFLHTCMHAPCHSRQNLTVHDPILGFSYYALHKYIHVERLVMRLLYILSLMYVCTVDGSFLQALMLAIATMLHSLPRYKGSGDDAKPYQVSLIHYYDYQNR